MLLLSTAADAVTQTSSGAPTGSGSVEVEANGEVDNGDKNGDTTNENEETASKVNFRS